MGERGRFASTSDMAQFRISLSGVVLPGLALLIALPTLRAQQRPLLADGVKALYQNEFAKAETLARQFLTRQPTRVDAMVVLARAQMAQGKLELAYETLRKALRIQPQHIDVLYYLGGLSRLLSQGQYEGLYAMAPDSARAHQLLAELAESRGDSSKAEEEYEAALGADPQSVGVLNALGLIQQRKFQFNEAISYYLKAAAIEPRNFESLYGLGSAYLYLQQPEMAVEVLRQAAEVDPESPVAHFALGDALLRLGRIEEAVASLNASLDIHPELRQAYVLLARAYRKQGKTEEASKASAKANELQQKEREKLVDTLRTDDADSSPPSPCPSRDEDGTLRP